MELVILVGALALVQHVVFGFLAGQARNRYGIEAPAVSGDPMFERYFRVHTKSKPAPGMRRSVSASQNSPLKRYADCSPPLGLGSPSAQSASASGTWQGLGIS